MHCLIQCLKSLIIWSHVRRGLTSVKAGRVGDVRVDGYLRVDWVVVVLVDGLGFQVEATRMLGGVPRLFILIANYHINLLSIAVSTLLVALAILVRRIILRKVLLYYLALFRRQHHLNRLLVLRNLLVPFALAALLFAAHQDAMAETIRR